jgi:hypothetical protein
MDVMGIYGERSMTIKQRIKPFVKLIFMDEKTKCYNTKAICMGHVASHRRFCVIIF